MRINAIGLGFGNLKPNKIKKNSSKVMSNPVESSQKLAKLSLEQLQGMNNISFRGNEIANSPDILNSPLLETDENGQTFFHKASIEDLKAKKQEITPQLLKIALPMQDNDGNTCLYYTKGPEFINIVADILGDEAPETFAKTCAAKNENNIALLDRSLKRKKLNEEYKAIFKALGNKTAEVVRNYRGLFGSTIFHEGPEPELVKIIIKNLGDEAQQILSEMLPMQSKSQDTFLHFTHYPETLEIYAETLKDKAPEIFANALTTENINGTTPIDLLFGSIYGTGEQGSDVAKVTFKASGNKTAEVVRNYRGLYGGTIFHKSLEPELAQIIVDNMGDEAQQVIYEMLPMQNKVGNTFLDYGVHQPLETIKIYAKALKDKASETFAKVYPSEYIDEAFYGYFKRKLIQSIIKGEKV